MNDPQVRPVEILLVEDSPSEVLLTKRVLKKGKVLNNLHIAKDGEAALDFLHRRGTYREAPRPDLILLDLNLPNIDGREVLAEIKQDDALKSIPVVVLTTSDAQTDIQTIYHLQANCYVTKPLDVRQFGQVIGSIVDFWFSIARLPEP